MVDIKKIPFAEGLQLMPVLSNKKPIHEHWQEKKVDYDFSRAEAVGLVCGKISGNIEAIDFDLKYCLTGKMFAEYCALVKLLDPTLLPKMVVQKTVSGGYHFIYRCSYIEGNLKLANRYTTDEEKKATYEKSYKAEYEKQIAAQHEIETAERESTIVATNSAKNDKVRVLIETRGDKGYIAIAPTNGYELKQGSFDKIQTITPEQRSILFNVAFGFNEVLKEVVHREVRQTKQIKGMTPIEDYHERGDVVGLLEKHGWVAVGKKGPKILMKRPGDTKADHSGNYDEERKWFSVFSTSTQFEAQTPYKPYAVFTMLELDGDYQKTPKALYDLGYGDRQEDVKRQNESIPTIVNMEDDDDLSFFAMENDYEDYLKSWRTNTFEMGKTTGIPELDVHFLFKEGNLVVINGIDNVGKSSVVWYFAMLSAILHDWCWVIFSSENRVGGVIRKLIEFYWSIPIDKLTESQYETAKKFVNDHFSIIKCGEVMYNYKDILNMTTKALKKKKYKGLMIDPYNSLKADLPNNSKQQIYDYNYEAASVIQLYAKNNNIAIYLNQHVGTSAARNKDKNQFTRAPQKEDSEMGVMWANKADEFLTIHRVTQDEKNYMFTEIHVRKVKERETGGSVTYFYKPVDLIMVNNYSGFVSVPKRGAYTGGTNAITNYHKGIKAEAKPFLEPADIPSYESEPFTSEDQGDAPF